MRGRIDRAQVASLNACASAFTILICIDKMAFSCLTVYFPHSLLPFTHITAIHSNIIFCFLRAAVAIFRNKLHFCFLSFFYLSHFFLLSIAFFPSYHTLRFTFSPHFSFLGLLNCAFYLYVALQYSGGGGLFSPYVHFRDRAVPQLSSFVSHPLSLAPMTVLN